MVVLRGKGYVPSIAVNYDKKRICWIQKCKRHCVTVIDLRIFAYLLKRCEKHVCWQPVYEHQLQTIDVMENYST